MNINNQDEEIKLYQKKLGNSRNTKIFCAQAYDPKIRGTNPLPATIVDFVNA